jgi:hypothetical protein
MSDGMFAEYFRAYAQIHRLGPYAGT